MTMCFLLCHRVSIVPLTIIHLCVSALLKEDYCSILGQSIFKEAWILCFVLCHDIYRVPPWVDITPDNVFFSQVLWLCLTVHLISS